MINGGKPRVLVLARNYPNPLMPTLGLWTERLVRASTESADPTVISPVPWSPPGAPEAFSRFRRVPRARSEDGIPVHHPRVFTGPGYLLHRFDARLWYPQLRRVADRLHRSRPFDLIHAHFIYPEGVIAARLGRRYGIPVVTTEQAPWNPWLADYPSVGRQVERALHGITTVTAVSDSHRRNILAAAPVAADRVEVLYNVVDETTFTPDPDVPRQADRILFVGVVRRVKGLDVLVRALGQLARTHPTLSLDVIGGAFYRGYQRDEAEVRQLARDIGLEQRVRFLGAAPPPEVAKAMRSSALLAVPSRSETFSAVTAEALACGTPVVATRCGGPEEILTDATGVLVAPEDPGALAAGITDVLARRSAFDGAALRRSVVSRYGKAAAAARLERLYRGVLHASAPAGASPHGVGGRREAVG